MTHHLFTFFAPTFVTNKVKDETFNMHATFNIKQEIFVR